ncbi:TPA: hypothetical protein HA241_00600 [Candidatus Woesearchaeota archaeon]|nr:hypothetical protein [Candidatus Woesearchaeota archaeon]
MVYYPGCGMMGWSGGWGFGWAFMFLYGLILVGVLVLIIFWILKMWKEVQRKKK